MRIAALYRYPVKGLSPEPLATARLTAGAYFPGDRLYAIENGPSGFDPGAPQHQPKVKFLMLMRNEALARLHTRYDDASTTLTIESAGRETVSADLTSREGRLVVEAFMRRVVPADLRGPPKVVAAPDGFRFTDSRRGFVSLINLASVEAIAAMVGKPVDPRRFRGNVLIEGMAAWAELDLVGQTLVAPSGPRFKVTKRIQRCAATNVDPVSAERDLDIPRTLMQRLGHLDCGIYAEVTLGGDLSEGGTLAVEPDRQGRLGLDD